MDGIEYFNKSMGKPLGGRELIALFEYGGGVGGIINKL